MSPVCVPNFSPIRARIRVLWRVLQSVRDEVVVMSYKKTDTSQLAHMTQTHIKHY